MDLAPDGPELRMAEGARFVLFLGNINPSSAASRLKASGVRYVQKRLESRPANWASITSYLNDPGLICVVGRLNTAVFNALASPEYSPVAPTLLAALSRVPHMLFAHESVMTGERTTLDDSDQEQGGEDDDSWIDYLHSRGHFSSPSGDVRIAVLSYFADFGVRVIPYSTNAEFEVMADEFVEDNERDLLFRVYVPAGRLYAAEADKLLSLFREWLSKVGKQGVRQGGYETGAGHMYEFYGDGRERSQDLSADFKDFSSFLDLCIEDPSTAVTRLVALGLDGTISSGLVTRYGKEGRRLQLDLRHEREQRVMGIRHQLESEVLETVTDSGRASRDALLRLVDELVPSPTPGLASVFGPGIVASVKHAPINVQLNQQIITAVESTVVQNVQGTTNVGPEVKDILALIERHGGPDSGSLTTAVFELEDKDAGMATRVRAKQLLKGFLIKISGIGEKVATTALTKYLETKMGV